MARSLALLATLVVIQPAYAGPPPLTAHELIVATTESRPAFERCYRRAGLALETTGAIVAVEPSGRVRKVILDDTTPRSVAGCVVAVVHRWRFHPSDDGVTAWLRLAGHTRA